MGQVKILVLFVAFLALFSSDKTVESQHPLQHIPSDSYFSFSKSNSKDNEPVLPNQQVTKVKSGTYDDRTLPWRLPREVIPIDYRVTISPVLDAGQEAVGAQWTTPGEVSISVRAENATSRITLHSHPTDVTVHDIKVYFANEEIRVVNYENADYEFLTIDLEKELEQSQQYTIWINFTSLITTKLNGLYRSSYLDPITNETKWIATTQMEATHARQLFPCLDEPGIKSTFLFKIGRMQKHLVLFNTEKTGQSDGPAPGWVYDSFAWTPVMSPYLLAVIISEFEYEEAEPNLFPNHRIRTYAPRHYIQAEGGVYAAENAAKVLAYFSTYFENEYPINKMDSAAVPDFFFGAMENYGLNIYRESALLVFPGVSLESERWSVTSVIAHELAHQWFGNLVSPAWWTYVWLNEGFATYFAAIGAAHTNPEFESTKRFLTDTVHRAMEYSADPQYAHSVKIDEMEWGTKGPMDWFDRMAYDQGGSLIRMMDGFLSTPLLTIGLRAYLLQLAYGSAQQDNLFRHLNSVATPFKKLPEGLTMKDVMDTWTLKPGFPLIRVSKSNSTRIYVSQEKFTNNAGTLKKVETDNELWHVPISVATKSSPNFDPEAEQWLDKDTAMTSWEINAEEWIILNAGATGYYRVLYDEALTNLIKAQLDSNHTVIDDFTRSQLLDDYFTAAYQKYISLGRALELTSYIGNDTEIIVWNVLLKHLRKPLNLLSSTSSGGSLYESFRNYLLPKLKNALNSVGGIGQEFPERAGMPILRHQQFVDWTCAFEDDECQDFALDHIHSWINTGNNTIPRDIQQIVYCSAVANGNYDVFQFIKGMYGDARTSEIQRSRLLNALACTSDSGDARGLLEGSITSGYFNTNSDGSRILGRLAMTHLGRSATFQFLRENAKNMIDYFGSAEPIRTIYTNAASYIGSTTELADLEDITGPILELITDENIKRDINQSLTTIRSNIEWLDEFSEHFQSFFSSIV